MKGSLDIHLWCARPGRPQHRARSDTIQAHQSWQRIKAWYYRQRERQPDTKEKKCDDDEVREEGRGALIMHACMGNGHGIQRVSGNAARFRKGSLRVGRSEPPSVTTTIIIHWGPLCYTVCKMPWINIAWKAYLDSEQAAS